MINQMNKLRVTCYKSAVIADVNTEIISDYLFPLLRSLPMCRHPFVFQILYGIAVIITHFAPYAPSVCWHDDDDDDDPSNVFASNSAQRDRAYTLNFHTRSLHTHNPARTHTCANFVWVLR